MYVFVEKAKNLKSKTGSLVDIDSGGLVVDRVSAQDKQCYYQSKYQAI